ncbi:hypothetical protein [Streptomyces sp. NPDC060035]
MSIVNSYSMDGAAPVRGGHGEGLVPVRYTGRHQTCSGIKSHA